MAPQETTRSRNLALDSLRCLAALVVFCQHFSAMFEVHLPRALVTGLFDSKGAVTLFFVLSGYVLALSLQREEPSIDTYVRFGIRRVFRLYPIYWAALLLTFFLLMWIRSSGGFSYVSETDPTYLRAIGPQTEQWLLQTTLIAPGMRSDFAILPVWTLMAEAKVSIVFPLLAWVVLRGTVAMVTSFLAFLILGSHWLDQYTVGTIALLGQFALGALLARLPGHWWKTVSQTKWWLLLGGSLTLYCCESLRYVVPSVWIAHYACAFGAAGLVLCGTHWDGFRATFERIQKALRVDLSYGIYILHFPIILALRKLWQDGNLPLPWPMNFVLALLGTVAIALALHYTIEMPAVRLGRQLTRRKHQALAHRLSCERDALPTRRRHHPIAQAQHRDLDQARNNDTQ